MLRGLRVIELATYIAAPGAAGIMADWGADVVKIESPQGDPRRHGRQPHPPKRTPMIFKPDSKRLTYNGFLWGRALGRRHYLRQIDKETTLLRF